MTDLSNQTWPCSADISKGAVGSMQKGSNVEHWPKSDDEWWILLGDWQEKQPLSAFIVQQII